MILKSGYSHLATMACRTALCGRGWKFSNQLEEEIAIRNQLHFKMKLIKSGREIWGGRENCCRLFSIICRLIYQVVTNLPLTAKQKFRFSQAKTELLFWCQRGRLGTTWCVTLYVHRISIARDTYFSLRSLVPEKRHFNRHRVYPVFLISFNFFLSTLGPRHTAI